MCGMVLQIGTWVAVGKVLSLLLRAQCKYLGAKYHSVYSWFQRVCLKQRWEGHKSRILSPEFLLEIGNLESRPGC